jgi:hypothetical protein
MPQGKKVYPLKMSKKEEENGKKNLKEKCVFVRIKKKQERKTV